MLKYRLISGPLLIAIVVAIVNYVPGVGAWMVLLLLSGLAQWEFYELMRTAKLPVFRIVGVLVGSALISVNIWLVGFGKGGGSSAYDWESGILALTVLLIFVRQFPQKDNDKPLETIGATLLGIFYVPYLFTFIGRLAFWYGCEPSSVLPLGGKMLVLFFIVVVKLSDIGAYTVGRLLGRHKLFPRLSPKKTWEGLAGGVLFSSAGAALLSLWFGRYSYWVGIGPLAAALLGVTMAVVGVIGDMFESLIKRACGVKDSSAMIPGMGGLLDVFDSLLFGAPVFYLLLKCMV